MCTQTTQMKISKTTDFDFLWSIDQSSVSWESSWPTQPYLQWDPHSLLYSKHNLMSFF